MMLIDYCSPNALTIHYTSNNQLIRENELILIDAGCEYKYVSPSVTRAVAHTAQRVRLRHQ